MANFHLILMLETTKYLGFYPDTSDVDMPFEMTEGVLPFHAISSLSEHETNLFKTTFCALIPIKRFSRYRKTTVIKNLD
jgi:hypothetical protein